MRRHLLGIIALVLILAGVVNRFVDFGSTSHSGMEDAGDVGLRAGLVLGALWIAYPQLVQLAKRFPKWLYAILAMVTSVVMFGPRSLIIVAPALVILLLLQVGAWLLKPLPKKRTVKKEKGERV
jgi:flagellar biogenesis protein FliO